MSTRPDSDYSRVDIGHANLQGSWNLVPGVAKFFKVEISLHRAGVSGILNSDFGLWFVLYRLVQGVMTTVWHTQ